MESEAWKDEVELLSAVFLDDFLDLRPTNNILNSPPVFQIKVYNTNPHIYLLLKIVCTFDYPSKPPKFFIIKHDGIEKSHVGEIKKYLVNQANLMRGSQMLFEILIELQNQIIKFEKPLDTNKSNHLLNDICDGSIYDEKLYNKKLIDSKIVRNELEKFNMFKKIKPQDCEEMEWKQNNYIYNGIEQDQLFIQINNITTDKDGGPTSPDTLQTTNETKFEASNNTGAMWILKSPEGQESRLLQDFENIEKLGHGGFGDVVRARNKLDGRIYAIKRVPIPNNSSAIQTTHPHLPSREDLPRGFDRKIAREIELLSSLNHENIVRYYNSWFETFEQTSSHYEDEDGCDTRLLNGDNTTQNERSHNFNLSHDSENSSRIIESSFEDSSPSGTSSISPNPNMASRRSKNSISCELGLMERRRNLVPFLRSVSNGTIFDCALECENPCGTEGQHVKHTTKVFPNDDDDENELTRSIAFSFLNYWSSQSEDDEMEEIDNVAVDHFNTKSEEINSPSFLLEQQQQIPSCKLQRFICIQMEFCEHRTLRNAIDRKSLYDHPQKAWRYSREIIEGLVYLHEQGIVHRDLKPANIFLDAKDRIKIGDFGLATGQRLFLQDFFDDRNKSPQQEAQLGQPKNSSKERSYLSNQIVGTALYMAPEIKYHTKNGGRCSTSAPSPYKCDEKVDVYSLGIIFFEIWFPPFNTVMERIKTLNDLRKPQIILPVEFEIKHAGPQTSIIKWLLNHDPSKRPTCKELLMSGRLPALELEEIQMDTLIRKAILPNTSSTLNQFNLQSSSYSLAFRKILNALFHPLRYPKLLRESSHSIYETPGQAPTAPSSGTNLLTPQQGQQQQHVVESKILLKPYLQAKKVSNFKIVTGHILRVLLDKHGVISFDLPLFIPPSSQFMLRGENGFAFLNPNFAQFLDPSGGLLTLFPDSKAALARHVALNDVTSLKRYNLDCIYAVDLSNKSASSHPRKMNVMNFDIIAPAKRFSPLSQMECLYALFDVLTNLPYTKGEKYEIYLTNTNILNVALTYFEFPEQIWTRVCELIITIWRRYRLTNNNNNGGTSLNTTQLKRALFMRYFQIVQTANSGAVGSNNPKLDEDIEYEKFDTLLDIASLKCYTVNELEQFLNEKVKIKKHLPLYGAWQNCFIELANLERLLVYASTSISNWLRINYVVALPQPSPSFNISGSLSGGRNGIGAAAAVFSDSSANSTCSDWFWPYSGIYFVAGYPKKSRLTDKRQRLLKEKLEEQHVDCGGSTRIRSKFHQPNNSTLGIPLTVPPLNVIASGGQYDNLIKSYVYQHQYNNPTSEELNNSLPHKTQAANDCHLRRSLLKNIPENENGYLIPIGHKQTAAHATGFSFDFDKYCKIAEKVQAFIPNFLSSPTKLIGTNEADDHLLDFLIVVLKNEDAIRNFIKEHSYQKGKYDVKSLGVATKLTRMTKTMKRNSKKCQQIGQTTKTNSLSRVNSEIKGPLLKESITKPLEASPFRMPENFDLNDFIDKKLIFPALARLFFQIWKRNFRLNYLYDEIQNMDQANNLLQNVRDDVKCLIIMSCDFDETSLKNILLDHPITKQHNALPSTLLKAKNSVPHNDFEENLKLIMLKTTPCSSEDAETAMSEEEIFKFNIETQINFQEFDKFCDTFAFKETKGRDLNDKLVSAPMESSILNYPTTTGNQIFSISTFSSHINIVFVPDIEKLSTYMKRKYETTIISKLYDESAIPTILMNSLLNSNNNSIQTFPMSCTVLAVELPAAVLKFFFTYYEINSSTDKYMTSKDNYIDSALQEKHPKYKKYMIRIAEQMDKLKQSSTIRRIFFIVLYSLKDNVYKIFLS